MMAPNLTLCAILIFYCQFAKIAAQVPFNQYFYPAWGSDHIAILDRGRQAEIRIDQHSGGGFISKQTFGSGYFRMSVQIPKNSKGIVTTFYLTSNQGGNHDELDFELLGSSGPSYILNTNVFAQDSGNREQQFKLWFDPTSSFHDYAILWNQHQIVFYVDKVPIRVFENKKNMGARFPTLPMYVRASIWNGTHWLGPVDWSKGPFVAEFGGFEINACPCDRFHPTKCYALNYPWNSQRNWHLPPDQQRAYQNIRKTYMTYDYCNSKVAKSFRECQIRH